VILAGYFDGLTFAFGVFGPGASAPGEVLPATAFQRR